ncbi:hypothetical protein GWK47_016301 [Chionoecetes opilio]|uniref:Uncharacterized protein n=1 Tax=Chionoecetes opilio TaxID=41210 RepID=A0A8J4XRJ9_CHIOP|nr:hypothetical protein GWK47_016301 [Chionoecetes opilio]
MVEEIQLFLLLPSPPQAPHSGSTARVLKRSRKRPSIPAEAPSSSVFTFNSVNLAQVVYGKYSIPFPPGVSQPLISMIPPKWDDYASPGLSVMCSAGAGPRHSIFPGAWGAPSASSFIYAFLGKLPLPGGRQTDAREAPHPLGTSNHRLVTSRVVAAPRAPHRAPANDLALPKVWSGTRTKSLAKAPPAVLRDAILGFLSGASSRWAFFDEDLSGKKAGHNRGPHLNEGSGTSPRGRQDPRGFVTKSSPNGFSSPWGSTTASPETDPGEGTTTLATSRSPQNPKGIRVRKTLPSWRRPRGKIPFDPHQGRGPDPYILQVGRRTRGKIPPAPRAPSPRPHDFRKSKNKCHLVGHVT